eukprot:TRINITY_DN7583_c0_g1_i1.p1 TRINITY_DN7583_c0_g1~~TRINITY_DN7583_c0_g1_i1.p1  ORF type:complete len:511 (+),score=120.32 TRINITY_DN7583_c0_g1_i1:108-1640(+)
MKPLPSWRLPVHTLTAFWFGGLLGFGFCSTYSAETWQSSSHADRVGEQATPQAEQPQELGEILLTDLVKTELPEGEPAQSNLGRLDSKVFASNDGAIAMAADATFSDQDQLLKLGDGDQLLKLGDGVTLDRLAKLDLQSFRPPPELDATSVQLTLTDGNIQDTQIERLEQTLVSLAAGNGIEDADATKPLVDEMQDLVQDTMLPQLFRQRNESQRKLASLLQEFDKCNFSPSHAQSWTSYDRNHRDCRTNESEHFEMLQEVTGNWTRHKEVSDKECGAFDVIDRIPDSDECGVPESPSVMRSYIESLRNMFKHRYEHWLEKKQHCETFRNVTNEWFQKKTALEDTLASIRSKCDALQDVQDHFACAVNVVAYKMCLTYTDCYDSALCDYQKEMSRASDLEESLKPKYRALKRIECIILAFGKTDMEAAIETCRSANYSSQAVHIERCHSSQHEDRLCPPARRNCSAEAAEMPWPNSSAYVDLVYKTQAPNSRPKPCDAEPCCRSENASVK